MKKPCSATDPLWYKDAIIYELHVRAFADSNGDGIGDFPGLLSRLDYLQELGVTCLWILPFFPSPLRDDGYDIADYTSVNPSYGTIDDFKQFLDEAHARNMQVMIELVINHTSDQHPWFRRARTAPKGSPERDFYVWSDTDQIYKDARIIFTDTEKSNWTWDEVAGQYYWHRFFSHQPDLNFENPAVMEEVLKAMRFWLDMGVDAMRMDAIPYLVERDGTNCENLPQTHAVIKQIRAAIDEGYENRLVLAEANQWPADVRPYFGDGDECHMAFHFPLMPRIYMALRQEDRLPITDIMAQTPEIPANCQWGLFLRNHDELTLEMVTDDERDYMYLAYSSDPRMRINVGIRRRLAPLVDNNRRRIELLNSLLFSFPGTPILYYGDEIGMGDNIYLGDRNGVRTPMQWNSDRNAGFSKAVPARLYFPVIMDPIWGYQAINVEAQQSDPSSLLHWTRNMIALRKLFQVFGRGTLEFLHPENRKVLAYVRNYDGTDGHSETVLCVANLSRFAQPVSLDLSRFAGRQPVEMLGYVPFPVVTDQPYLLTLAPYSFFWLELQESAGTSVTMHPDKPVAPIELTTDQTPSPSFSDQEMSMLQSALPGYLASQRWFGGKSLGIFSIAFVLSEAIDDTNATLHLLEVTHQDGTTSRYQLLLAIAEGAALESLSATSPQSVILQFDRKGVPAGFYEATADPTVRSALLRMILAGSARTNSGSDLVAASAVTDDQETLLHSPSRVGSAEQSNTSILYGDRAILKLFRHVSAGQNPDVEVVRFLTNVAGFSNIPAYLGDLHLRSDGTTIAFLQAFAKNQGDGWAWTLEQLDSFYAAVSGTNGNEAAVRELAGGYRDAADLLGRRTAEMHLALATPTGDPAFQTEPLLAQDLIQLRESIQMQAQKVMDALQSRLDDLPQNAAPIAAELLRNRERLYELLRTDDDEATHYGLRQRIHGDYHLGQLLRTEDDFMIVDFEGEPARPLEERRKKQSPQKDVAGMLRSFSYAVHTAFERSLQTQSDQKEKLQAATALWEKEVAAAFLKAYRETASHREDLLPPAALAEKLLQMFLLEKTLYEVMYELNNRPAWLRIPLQGLLTQIGHQT